MSDIPQSESRPQRRTVAVESLSVSPKVAGQMLDYGKTKVAELIKNQELESYVDRGARRVVTASIYAYVARKIEATKTLARRGRPKKKRS